MYILFSGLVAGVLLLSGSPARAQQETGPSAAQAANPAAAEQRIADLEAQLARQTRIADNARQSLDALRAETKLKDELLVLGRQRNAELYAIATEIAGKYVRSHSVDPFFQQRRVTMENLKQSYEDRLRAARIYESTLPPSVEQRMNAELGKAPENVPSPAAASTGADKPN